MDDLDDVSLFEPIRTQHNLRRERRKLAYGKRRKGCYKNGYATRKQALTARNQILKERDVPNLRIYKCHRCGLWHLTHQPDRKIV